MHINKVVAAKKSLLIAAAGLVAIIAILELSNTTHWFHKQPIPAVIPANQTKNIVSTQNSNNSAPSSSTSSNNSTPSSSTTDLDHTLIAPSGTFVSNHYPGRNGSPTVESSSCITTPGATCYIKFTSVGTQETTQLPTQTTDARGYTNWYWDVVKDAHLTSGQWKVTAVAALGSQTKTTDDAAELVIQ